MLGPFGGLLVVLALLTARDNPLTALLWAAVYVAVAVPLAYYGVV